MSLWARTQWQVSVLQLLSPPRKLFTPYLLPILFVFLALQSNWLMAPSVSVLPPFLAFLAAIMITAWFEGFLSAMFATVLSAFTINYYFIPPIYDFALKPGDAVPMGFFVIEALTISYCIDYLKKNEESLRRANRELEHQVVNERQQLTEKEDKLRGLMHQLAVTEERERGQLAAELHDYLAQLLTLARMKIKQVQQCLYRSVGESNRYAGETDELLRKSVEYVRTLMAELYPVQLHELGLPAALHSLAEQMSRHGLTVDLSIDCDSLPLPNDQGLLLYQSVRELLMNIVKHAGVNRAVVALEVVDSDRLLISVRDTGRGFDPSTLPSTASGQHFGLSSVRERITTMGGTFTVDSTVGQGTAVTLCVALQPLLETTALRAASSTPYDRVKAKPTGAQKQETLPL
jgi:signal transduction histidine kinase